MSNPWITDPTGNHSNTLWGVKCVVAKVTGGVGRPPTYRVSIDGIASADLPNAGIVKSAQEGKSLCYDTLRKKVDTEREQQQQQQQNRPPYRNQVIETRARALESAVSIINGLPDSMLPTSAPDATPNQRIADRLRLITRTADALHEWILAPQPGVPGGTQPPTPQQPK